MKNLILTFLLSVTFGFNALAQLPKALAVENETQWPSHFSQCEISIAEKLDTITREKVIDGVGAGGTGVLFGLGTYNVFQWGSLISHAGSALVGGGAGALVGQTAGAILISTGIGGAIFLIGSGVAYYEFQLPKQRALRLLGLFDNHRSIGGKWYDQAAIDVKKVVSAHLLKRQPNGAYVRAHVNDPQLRQLINNYVFQDGVILNELHSVLSELSVSPVLCSDYEKLYSHIILRTIGKIFEKHGTEVKINNSALRVRLD